MVLCVCLMQTLRNREIENPGLFSTDAIGSVEPSYLISDIESLDGGVDDELVIGGYDTYVVNSPQHRCQH